MVGRVLLCCFIACLHHMGEADTDLIVTARQHHVTVLVTFVATYM